MATITVTNSRLNFDASSRKMFLTYTVSLDSGEVYQSITVASNRQWCNVKNKTVTVYQTEIELSNNRTLEARDAQVTITVTTSTGTYVQMVVIHQDEFKLYPIWANNVVRVETLLNSVKYEVRYNSETIYSGKAYVIPNTNYVEIDMSKICASYLNSSLEGIIDAPANYNTLNSVKKFALYINGNLEGAYMYYNSYTYAPTPEYLNLLGGETMLILSDPIRKVFDSRQYIVYSLMNVLIKSGGSGIPCYAYFYNSKNERTEVFGSLSVGIGYVTMMKAPEDAVAFEMYGQKTPIKKTCCKYCLYYQNALGGWDSFLIDGNDKRTDKITSYNYIKAVDNTTKSFGTKKYMNTISTAYKLHTDWLNDDEASRMHHLLESTEVYLHNLEDDTIIPVNITNNSCEFKTFTNNGKKKFNYEINVELARTKVRQ